MFRQLAAYALALALTAPAFAEEPPLRDPMRPYAPSQSAPERASAPDPLSLTAVLVSASRRIAIINGDTYREGDEIDGATITRIDRGAVALERGGRHSVLRLPSVGIDVRTNAGDGSR